MIKPAPWKLEGSGFLVLLKRSALKKVDGSPIEGRGWFSYLMCLEYRNTPVGDYRELLLIPTLTPGTKGASFTISHIYVDSQDSLESGRSNWGIPKELADMPWTQTRKTMALDTLDGDQSWHASVKSLGPSLPFNTRLLPFPIIFQHDHDGKTYRTRPSATGWSSLGKVETLDLDGFADIQSYPKSAVVSVTFVSKFSMRFPEAEVFDSSE